MGIKWGENIFASFIVTCIAISVIIVIWFIGLVLIYADIWTKLMIFAIFGVFSLSLIFFTIGDMSK